MESRALVFDVEDCYTSQRGAIYRRERGKMALFNYIETGCIKIYCRGLKERKRNYNLKRTS